MPMLPSPPHGQDQLQWLGHCPKLYWLSRQSIEAWVPIMRRRQLDLLLPDRAREPVEYTNDSLRIDRGALADELIV